MVWVEREREPPVQLTPRTIDVPEETEIDTDGLRETIDRENERSGGRLLRLLALVTAFRH